MHVPPEALPFSYVNGAVLPSRRAVVSAFDRGFLVADGIFETFHIVEGVPLSFEAHLTRLKRSADFMRLALNDDAPGNAEPRRRRSARRPAAGVG